MADITPSCPSNIIDLLAKQPSGVYTKEIIQKQPFRNLWWYNRVKRGTYPQGMGPNPLRRVIARQAGGEIYPFRKFSPSNGSGSAADNVAAGQPIGTAAHSGCCPSIVPLSRGYINKGVEVFNLGWGSRQYCAKDFTQSLDPLGDLRAEFEGYGPQIGASIATFQRNEYIRLCTTKVYEVNGTGMFNRAQTNTVGDSSYMEKAHAYTMYANGINPTTTDPNTGITGTIYDNATYLGLDVSVKPTGFLSQDLLTKVSQWLNTEGVNGIKMLNGAQQYEIVTSVNSADKLLRDVTNAVIFEYSDMGTGDNARLLGGLGQALNFRGWVYQQDPYCPRLDANYNFVLAKLPVATDSGVEWVMNSAWFKAPYEISVAYTDDVYDVVYPSVASAPGGNVAFPGYNYAGELKFVLNPTHISPLQNTGYFYSEILIGSFKGYQRLAAIIIHLNCHANQITDCSGTITTY